IGHFTLVKMDKPSLTFPDGLVLMKMFDEKPVDADVVTAYNEAVFAQILIPTHAVSVVRAPEPEVISDGIMAIDLHAAQRAPGETSADAAEHIVDRARILRVVGAAPDGPYDHQCG